MADAGKIMIMPKGAYDAGTSYEVLDLVTHKGNVWVAKRNVAGVEPSEANSADWFLMADLANYLPLSGGGSVVGSVYATSKSANSVVIGASNTLATATVRASSSGTHGVYSDTHGKWIASADSNGNVTLNGTATGNLPNDRAVATNFCIGNLNMIGFTGFTFRDADNQTIGHIGLLDGALYLYNKSATSYKELLTTGNKPSGTYTGNGSATARTINIGGIGNALVINGSYTTVWVGNNGAIGFYQDSTEVGILNKSEMFFKDGVLTISTAKGLVNSSGSEFTYQVL